MPRFIQVTLEKRRVSCTARLLDEEAPLTSNAVWDALPLSGEAWHAKYASNEVYTLVPPFAAAEPGFENTTVTPLPGDLLYWFFQAGQVPYRLREERGLLALPGMIDLAIFYRRNNLLLDPTFGFVPGNVFGTVVENFDAMAAACQDVWRSGSVGEELSFRLV
jgi:hypothetical protein